MKQRALSRLLQARGGVGDAEVIPMQADGRVGNVNVQPRFPGRVGARAERVPGQAERPFQYTSQVYTAGNQAYLGIGDLTVQSNAVVAGQQSFRIRPDRPITPQWWAFTSAVRNILLNQISISGTNMFANDAGIPIEFLSEVSNCPQVLMPTIQPSTGVIITVTNLIAQDQPLRGGAYGSLVRI